LIVGAFQHGDLSRSHHLRPSDLRITRNKAIPSQPSRRVLVIWLMTLLTVFDCNIVRLYPPRYFHKVPALRFLARIGLTRLIHEDLVVQAVPLLVTIEDFARVDQVERQFPDGIPDRIAGHDEIVAREYLLALGQLELVEQQRRRGMRRATGDADGVEALRPPSRRERTSR